MAFRILFLNLPSKDRIIRRYMCSYNSPTFLYPPTELICLAAIARDWHKHEVCLIDAIAESLTTEVTIQRIQKFKPDMVLCLTGFECFEEDLNVIREFKKTMPQLEFVVFGHYPTEFPKVVIEESGADFVLLGEPDLTFDALLSFKAGEKLLSEIGSLAYRNEDGEAVVSGKSSRIPDPNELPMPAYDLLKNQYYSEPFLARPFGLIQTARGCPYKCNYCVRSFGVKLTALTPERIMEHIHFLIQHHGIRSLRFIDDTFTATPARVVRLCKLMIEANLNLEWSCLSRADTLNREMLQWMKKAGCIRLYFGIESGSQRMLDIYDKGINANLALQNLKYCRDLGLDTVGFFMVGHPEESTQDIRESVRFAHNAGLSFIAVSGLMFYPGTAMFEKNKHLLEFNIYPYSNRFSDPRMEDRKYRLEKEFYRRFYLSPRFMASHAIRLLKTRPGDFFRNVRSYLEYALKPSNSKRKDLI